MHHIRIQLTPSLSLRGQDTPRSISAGARVNFTCAKTSKKIALGLTLTETRKKPIEISMIIFLTRVDPEVCKETSKRPMHLAWLNDHVGTMTELAKYGVEPDSEVRGSSDWQFVEKEQERRWENLT